MQIIGCWSVCVCMCVGGGVCHWKAIPHRISASSRSAAKLFVNWPAWESVGIEGKQLLAGCVAMCSSAPDLNAERHGQRQTAATVKWLFFLLFFFENCMALVIFEQVSLVQPTPTKNCCQKEASCSGERGFGFEMALKKWMCQGLEVDWSSCD